jgi:hypothetical protein
LTIVSGNRRPVTILAPEAIVSGIRSAGSLAKPPKLVNRDAGMANQRGDDDC